MKRRPDIRVGEKNFAMPGDTPPEEMPPHQLGSPDVPDDTTPEEQEANPEEYGSPAELFRSPQAPDFPDPRVPVEGRYRPHGKPFGFALAHGESGASIWWGVLLTTITIVNVTKVDGNIVIAGQPAIPTTTVTEPDNLDTNKLLQTHLGWYGNVYGYWEADDSGAITLFDVRGPDEPEGEDISQLNPDLSRDTPAGKYYVLIGTVEEDAPVNQVISGDIPWFVTILRGEGQTGSSASVGSGVSSSTSVPGSSSAAGSSKSTCIVHSSKHPTGCAALFLPEMPREGVFFDTLTVHLKRRITKAQIDPHFVEVCEQGMFSCIGYSVDGATYGLDVSIDNAGLVTIRRPWFSRPANATILIHAIRRGFGQPKNNSPFNQRRMPARTYRQLIQCEEFINSAYERHE